MRHTQYALAMVLLVGAGANAQDSGWPAGGALEQVVVTATKQEQVLSKVPISISAYTQDAMDARSIKSIKDIAAQTPGLDLGDQGSNGVGSRISIRGIDSNSGSSTTGVYLDDTPIQGRNNPVNLGGTVFPEVFDLERVEILRGPQGTLFGAGAEGGVVRFITPAPSLTKNSVYARSEVSSTQGGDPNYEAGAAFGGPLIDGKLGIRVSGWMRHAGGWVDRTAWETGQTFDNVNWSDSGGARVAVLWQATDSISITPSVLYQGQHQNDSPNDWTSLSDPGKGQFRSGYQLRQQSTEHFVLPSLKIEADLGTVLFTSISSFFHRSESNVSDVTNSDVPGALGAVGANGEDNFFPTVASGALVTDAFLGATRQNIFTQELRLQSTDHEAPLRWVGGLYFQNSRLNDTQLAPNAQLPQLFLEQQGAGAFENYYYTADCVDHCSGLINGVDEYSGNEHSRDLQIAVFGNVDWSMTQRLILNAGLRVERTQASFSAAEDGPVNNGVSLGGGSVSATPVTPKIGLSFQQDANTLFYGSIAKGYRPGGGNSHVPASCGIDLQNIGTDAAPAKYDSDSTWSYELGTKLRSAEGRVSLAASVFYIDWRNIQWYYFLPNCGYGIVFNLGRSRSEGFDLEFNARITRQLLAGLSVGYTDAKFRNTVILDPTTGTPVVAAGQTLGQAPWTVYATLEYQFDSGFYARLTDDFKSSNHGPYLYQNPASAVYDPDLNPNPSSNQLDVRVGKIWNEFDLSLFVNNALNAAPVTEMNHYVGYDFNSGNAVGSPIFAAATLRRRTYGVTGTYKF